MRPTPNVVPVLTFAIAPDAPVGVVIAAYSGRHSRMFLWETDLDRFTGGQFLKGRAFVEHISPDGRYVAYYAQSLGRKIPSFLAISHPPYFTALAVFPTFHLHVRHIRFRSNGIGVATSSHRYDWDTSPAPEQIIEPGCPFPIIREEPCPWSGLQDSAQDARHNRVVTTEKGILFATNLSTNVKSPVTTFPREEFKAMEPPPWSKKW